jgi:serine phosphatase RsbU (regulator of sigma subunit)
VIARPVPGSSPVHIVGNHAKLGKWDPEAICLEKQPDGTWAGTFLFETGTHLEYKITRGSWQTEAVNAAGVELPNAILEVRQDTTITISVANWRDIFDGRTVLSAERLQNKAGNIELFENWKYHPGDDSTWATPEYDDRGWESAGPLLERDEHPQSGWSGIGWFRLHMRVDSILWNVPLALYLRQAGASEVYLNGELLYRFGIVGASRQKERAYQDRNPKVITFGGQFDQLLAVRYSNFSADYFNQAGQAAGFTCILGDLNSYVDQRASTIRTATVYQLLFTAAPLALALMHFLMFLFYPRAKENLYYAVAMTGLAALTYSDFQWPFVTNPAHFVLLNRLTFPIVSVALLFGLLTAYAHVYEKLPKQIIPIALAAAGLAIWGFLRLDRIAGLALYGFIALVAVELLRVILLPSLRRKEGAVITGAGLIAAVLAFVYQILINLRVLGSVFEVQVVYVYGILILGISMSINLSRNYARTNKNLEQRLIQVQALSEKNLQQERRAKDEEIARLRLEADNARKTQELEAAHNLQLAMLPKEIPMLPHLDIAVYMKAATEVGGDYYDFDLARDGTLTVAVGDATDHGAKAGTMVAVTKGLFHELADNPDPRQVFEKYTCAFKRMHLGQLYMAMTLAKIKDHKMITAAAGMPPTLIYRAATRGVEEVALKGMPLGGFSQFPYQQQEIDLHGGDTIVLMSDGFPERFNDKGEILDYPRAKEIFAEVGDQAPQKIIDHFTRASEAWAKGQPQEDDVTFVVLKVKETAAVRTV